MGKIILNMLVVTVLCVGLLIVFILVGKPDFRDVRQKYTSFQLLSDKARTNIRSIADSLKQVHNDFTGSSFIDQLIIEAENRVKKLPNDSLYQSLVYFELGNTAVDSGLYSLTDSLYRLSIDIQLKTQGNVDEQVVYAYRRLAEKAEHEKQI